MNILIISRGYPSSKEPLWGNFEALQAKALAKLGHKVIVMSIDRRFRLSSIKNLGIEHRRDSEIEIFNFTVLPDAIFEFSNRLALKYNKKTTTKLFTKVIAQFGTPDIIYAHYLYNIYSAIEIKKEYNIPVVGIEHWSDLLSQNKNKYIDYIGNKTYRFADCVLSVSAALRLEIKRRFNVNSIVLHNMVDDDFINSGISNGGNNCFQFVSIGRLVGWKRFDMIIKSAIHLDKLRYNFNIKIIGNGDQMTQLSKLIADNNLQSKVILLGEKNKTEIIEILKNSDAFVLPSEHETFGVVYIEAMALGIPVIACNCGGPPSFITKSTGVLISKNNQNELNKAMVDMINHSSTYNRTNISNYIKQNFSSTHIAKKLSDLFNNIINERHE